MPLRKLHCVPFNWETNRDISGIFFFTGPVLLLLALVFEWIMGNFFSMMVMGMFAVFWLSFGLLELPSLGIAAAYSTTGDAAEGAASKQYNAAVALYLLIWGFWLFTTFLFTLKTNTVFALIFLCAFISSLTLSGAYWKVSTGDFDAAMRLQKVRYLSRSRSVEETKLITISGWRCYILRCCGIGMVYNSCYDGCGDEDYD